MTLLVFGSLATVSVLFSFIIDYLCVCLLIINYSILSGLWVKHLWETTNVMYKAALKEWNKGTGGGPGIDAAFQSWDDDKLEKYNVDLETYDHTDIASRPTVLFQYYSKGKVPILTVIRMWDKFSDYLLSSKHDPLSIGSGEIGFEDEHENNDPAPSSSSIISSSGVEPHKLIASPQRKKAKKRKNAGTELDGFDDLSTMMSSVVKTCKHLTTVSPATKSPSTTVSNHTVAIEDLPLDDLYKLIEQYRKHLDFLKEVNMCDTEKTKSIVDKCESVFNIINSRTATKSTQSNSVSNK